MPTTEYSIWDYAVSYGGPSLFMTAVFVVVLPLVYFKFARPRIQRWPPRIAVLLGVWVVAWCVAYGDVLWIARAAKRLCEEEAGLRIYKTARTSGFFGSNDIRKWASMGFDFVEFSDPGGSLHRYSVRDGRFAEKLITEIKSKYGYSARGAQATYGVAVRVEQVSDLASGEVLGERRMFRVLPGWIDRFVMSVVSGYRTPVYCFAPGEITSDTSRHPFSELILATLKGN